MIEQHVPDKSDLAALLDITTISAPYVEYISDVKILPSAFHLLLCFVCVSIVPFFICFCVLCAFDLTHLRVFVCAFDWIPLLVCFVCVRLDPICLIHLLFRLHIYTY